MPIVTSENVFFKIICGLYLICFNLSDVPYSHFFSIWNSYSANRNLMPIPDCVTWQRAFNIFQPLLKIFPHASKVFGTL